MTKETSQTCYNCKYYQHYYVLNAMLRFTPTNKGFCNNCGVNVNYTKRHLKQNCACDLWQPRELLKLKEQYGIEMKLQIVKEQLDDIIALLRDAE